DRRSAARPGTATTPESICLRRACKCARKLPSQFSKGGWWLAKKPTTNYCLLRQFRGQGCTGIRSDDLHDLAAVFRNPYGGLARFSFSGSDFEFECFEASRGHSDLLCADYFYLLQGGLLFLQVEVAERGDVAFSQRQRSERIIRPGAVGEESATGLGRDRFRLAAGAHRAAGLVVLKLDVNRHRPLFDAAFGQSERAFFNPRHIAHLAHRILRGLGYLPHAALFFDLGCNVEWD